jgi:hypothetical protein
MVNMPTYKNDTSTTISVNGVNWAPGSTKAVDFFVPLERGLTFISEEPRVDAQTLDASQISIPANDSVWISIPDCNEFFFSVIVDSGQVFVRENYLDNPVATLIDGTKGYEASMKRINIEAYYLTNVTSEQAIVTFNISRVS